MTVTSVLVPNPDSIRGLRCVCQWCFKISFLGGLSNTLENYFVYVRGRCIIIILCGIHLWKSTVKFQPDQFKQFNYFFRASIMRILELLPQIRSRERKTHIYISGLRNYSDHIMSYDDILRIEMRRFFLLPCDNILVPVRCVYSRCTNTITKVKSDAFWLNLSCET